MFGMSFALRKRQRQTLSENFNQRIRCSLTQFDKESKVMKKTSLILAFVVAICSFGSFANAAVPYRYDGNVINKSGSSIQIRNLKLRTYRYYFKKLKNKWSGWTTLQSGTKTINNNKSIEKKKQYGVKYSKYQFKVDIKCGGSWKTITGSKTKADGSDFDSNYFFTVKSGCSIKKSHD